MADCEIYLSSPSRDAGTQMISKKALPGKDLFIYTGDVFCLMRAKSRTLSALTDCLLIGPQKRMTGLIVIPARESATARLISDAGYSLISLPSGNCPPRKHSIRKGMNFWGTLSPAML